MKNSCYTYFRIVGEFEPNEISTMLDLTPYSMHRIGDMRNDGKTKYDFADWCFGKCNIYDIEVENQMLSTIKPLLGKIDVLNLIKKQYNVTFVLEVVPTIHRNESTPCLAPSLDIMDFCCKTGTTIDIDLYIN